MKNILSNRKGMESQLLIIILILVSAVVIYMVLTKFITSANADSEIQACRLSVLAQSATTLAPSASGWKSPLDLNCNRRYITFYDTKVEMGMSPENMKPMNVDYNGKTVTQFAQLSDTIVDQAVAEELRICKYQAGDGKVDIFPNENGIFNDQKICLICSEINFKSTVQKNTFSGLVDYTKRTTYATAGKTYYNYLTESTIDKNSMWGQPTFPGDSALSNLNINKDQTYVVFAEKVSFSTLSSIASPFWKALGYKESIWVGIVPSTDITNYCDVNAN